VAVQDLRWTDEGAFEVSPGVYRIPLPLPSDALRAVNVYAVVDGEGLVMVDGGWALQESQEQLARSLDKIGFALGDITDFLVTHIHRDHYTQAFAVRRLTGARVSLGAGERPSLQEFIAAWERGAYTFRSGARLIRADAHALRAEMLEMVAAEPMEQYEAPDRWLDDGTAIALAARRLEVVHTPGHTAGHVVFADPAAGALFAGDHVLPHITPSIGLEQAPTTMPLADYLNSLARVRAMPDAMLLPAHGPTAPSVHGRVDELLRHHADRLDASAKAVAHGADTALEVAKVLRWTRHERRLDELDLLSQSMAVAETLAHLDVLMARGQLSATRGADGTDHFQCA
jgi:glyoxylase-like metal-dependent hydrolase (beta-lactamase superfamily II)